MDDAARRPGCTVRRVRRDEARALATIRLAALRDSPSAFGSSFEAESCRTPDEWTARALAGAAGVDRVTFFALVHDEVVGLVGGFRPDGDGRFVELVSMWASPECRRAGVGRALVGAVIDWARDVSAGTVMLWVTVGNVPALRLYESMGFRQTGEVKPLPSDLSREEARMTLEL
jgi:ribosomal protein S18 acetylase RimI-like enzyme